MERLVEHYSDLYSRENTVSSAALDVIECQSTLDELDSEPSVEELSKVGLVLCLLNFVGAVFRPL